MAVREPRTRLAEVILGDGRTYTEVAAELRLSERTVRRWANGEGDPNWGNARRIGEYLNIDWRTLFDAPRDGAAS